jgi:hypothetical protein
VAAQPIRRLSGCRAWPALALAAACILSDSLSAQARPDTTGAADTLVTRLDTIPAEDTIPPSDLPRLRAAPPAGWATATWSWDREAYMGARDLTLLEFLETIPGLVPLRGGDYGAPESASALAMGGGRIRVFWDGFEMPPLDGGAPDLALIGLGGVEEVRVERGPTELRIHIESMRGRDPRPLSLVEAGTGDMDTNFFRGTFLHPRVLGGILGASLERVDSRGPFRREPGHRPGGWASWTRPIGSSLGLRFELRRANRDVDRVAAFPVGLARMDWTARARARVLDDRLTAELFTGRSTMESDEEAEIFRVSRSRWQHGARASLETGPFWASASARLVSGPPLPRRSIDVEGGGQGRLGGAYARWSVDRWQDEDLASLAAHVWTGSFRGFSAFASYGGGLRGGAVYPAYRTLPAEGEEARPPEEPTYRVSDLTTLRAGGAFKQGSVSLEGAWLRLEAEDLPPLGMVLDRVGPVAAGGTFTGWEANARLPLPLDGFTLGGWVQMWDKDARYLPKRSYQASIDFHDAFLPTRNLEVWGAFGVRGRDPMLVPSLNTFSESPELARVPFSQSWYTDVQVRILTVHLFIRWENFTLRQNLQDYPGRVLPYTRAVYGVKWIMWN